MSDLSDHAENLLLRWAFTDQAVTRPTAWHVALFTAAPNDAGGGVEVSGAGYARAAVSATLAGDTVTFDQAQFTCSDPAGWGTVVHAGIFDASGGGNLLTHKAGSPQAVVDGQDVFVNYTLRLA